MTDIEALDRKIKALAAKHGIDMDSDAFEIAVLLHESTRQIADALAEAAARAFLAGREFGDAVARWGAAAREGADAFAELGEALRETQDAIRCAECTCEAGGADCNWIKPGPAVDVTAMGDEGETTIIQPSAMGKSSWLAQEAMTTRAAAYREAPDRPYLPVWLLPGGDIRVVEWTRWGTTAEAVERAQEILDAGFAQDPDDPKTEIDI